MKTLRLLQMDWRNRQQPAYQKRWLQNWKVEELVIGRAARIAGVRVLLRQNRKIILRARFQWYLGIGALRSGSLRGGAVLVDGWSRPGNSGWRAHRVHGRGDRRRNAPPAGVTGSEKPSNVGLFLAWTLLDILQLFRTYIFFAKTSVVRRRI